MFNEISAILFFHCKTKGIDCSADCNNRDIYIYIYIYIYIHFRNMKKRLFSPVCSGISRFLPHTFCFSCLPTKYKTKCNTPFMVS